MRDIMNQFVKVKCKKCKNEQIIFERISRDVECLVCNELLAKSTGGKSKFLGTVIKK